MTADSLTVTMEEDIAKLETTTIADPPIDDDLVVTEDDGAAGEEEKPVEDPLPIKEKRRLYIGNLPYKVTTEAVKEFLTGFEVYAEHVMLN